MIARKKRNEGGVLLSFVAFSDRGEGTKNMELYVVFRVEHVSYYVYIFEGERFSLKYLYKGVFIAVHDDLSHVPTYLLRQGDLHKCLAYDWKRHFPAFTFFLTVGDSGSCSFNKRRVEKK